jgi:hypothetical protein
MCIRDSVGSEMCIRDSSKALEFGWEVTLNGWNALSNLQRYSLLKLTKPSHENKNFPIALREFGLV